MRTALGAASGQVMWLFLRRGLVQTSIGLALGVAGALGVGRIFEQSQLLVQMNGRDPATILSIALLLGAGRAGRLRLAGAPGDDARPAGRAAARLTRRGRLAALGGGGRRSGSGRNGRPSLRSAGNGRARSARAGGGLAAPRPRELASSCRASAPGASEASAAIPARAKQARPFRPEPRGDGRPRRAKRAASCSEARGALDTVPQRLPIISSRPQRVLADRGTDC